MPNRRSILVLVIAAIATVLGFALSRMPGSSLANAELNARDFLARQGKLTPANPKLIFLAIDSDSISLDAKSDLKALFGIEGTSTPEGRALALMSEHWPWPRSVYALLLDRLIGAGARAVVFDLNFPTPSSGDETFRAALERYADRVVIGSNFTNSLGNQKGRIDTSLTQPTPELIPQSSVPDSRVGYVNFWPDPDGVIRSARFQTNFAQFLGAEGNLGEANYISLAAQAVRKYGRGDLIPNDNEGRFFRYTAGPAKGFPPRSIFEVFVPEYWTRNYASGKVFDGAVVVVGAAGNWQHDEHLTPFGVMSGPEIQLNVVNALLHQEFLKPMSWLGCLLIYLLSGAFAVSANLFCTRPLPRLGMYGAAGALWVGMQPTFFNQWALLVPIVGPLAVAGATGLFGLIYDLVSAGAEQLRLHLTLQERKRAQEFLEQTNVELERRVAERTADLSLANTSLTNSLAEKDVLLKEVHHRVKNNLQVISSLLNLQSGYIKDPTALQVFIESRNRVRSMALIHEKLYQSADLSRIDFEDYIRTLSNGLLAGFVGKGSKVHISVEVEKIMLPVDSAVPCGLIVNELVTNCFKYAFNAETGGQIQISMRRVDDKDLLLRVSDNGVGFPKDVDFRNTESLGMQLVTTLAEQIDGTIALMNGTGTTFEITFPEAHKTKL